MKIFQHRQKFQHKLLQMGSMQNKHFSAITIFKVAKCIR